jgi:hypothetical protein
MAEGVCVGVLVAGTGEGVCVGVSVAGMGEGVSSVEAVAGAARGGGSGVSVAGTGEGGASAESVAGTDVGGGCVSSTGEDGDGTEGKALVAAVFEPGAGLDSGDSEPKPHGEQPTIKKTSRTSRAGLASPV